MSYGEMMALAERHGYKVDRDGADLLLIDVDTNTIAHRGGVLDLAEHLTSQGLP